jgi:hypothetical protein
VPLDAYRAVVDDARGALRVIRQAIEASTPPGMLPLEEAIDAVVGRGRGNRRGRPQARRQGSRGRDLTRLEFRDSTRERPAAGRFLNRLPDERKAA